MQRNFEFLRLKFPEKKRLRFFSLFVALSFFFWIITKLSNTYSSSVAFDVNFVDVPSLFVLDQNEKPIVKVDITASGFDLLMYHFFNNRINISLADADFGQQPARVDLMNQKFILQQQLFQNATLNVITPSSLTFSYGELKRKKVPVIPPEEVNFKPGFGRAGEWEIVPDSIWIYGPSQEIDSTHKISVGSLSEDNIDGDIDENITLVSPNQVYYETESVSIKTKVKRFTEKTSEVRINIKNLPDSLAIKLFPQSLKVTFLVLIDKAEEIKSSDFSFFCDFEEAESVNRNSLNVILEDEPDGVQNIRWTPKKVEYLIRK